jgi:hypothetical protein
MVHMAGVQALVDDRAVRARLVAAAQGGLAAEVTNVLLPMLVNYPANARTVVRHWAASAKSDEDVHYLLTVAEELGIRVMTAEDLAEYAQSVHAPLRLLVATSSATIRAALPDDSPPPSIRGR